MLVKLFCPICAYEQTKLLSSNTTIDVMVPLMRISDDGKYEVRCTKGHTSTVILDNIKFELLFEMGLNAIIDGYPREAVSSFASALERFYEFYWMVVMKYQNINMDDVNNSWKHMNKLSERQVGAYISAALLLTKKTPTLLKPDKEIALRNKVIHNGYIPTEDEAIEYGDAVMDLINIGIEQLRLHANDALVSVYDYLSPKDDNKDDAVMTGCVNILTTIDIRHPAKNDKRGASGINGHLKRVMEGRQPTKMRLLSKEEIDRHGT